MARGDRFFHHPTSTIYDRPEEHGLAYESVFFGGPGDARLHGWFFPAASDSGDRRSHGTVVHCHGNAGNVSGHYRFVAWLPRCGWNVFCFDYRGYGRSEGSVTREGTLADTHAAIDHVKTRHEVDPSRILLFGQSLGGGVAIVAASQRKDLAGVAVEGAFSGYRQEARFVCRRAWWLWGLAGLVSRWFVAGGCDAIAHVEHIGHIPKLFICGNADRIVDFSQTVALHERASEPKELWICDGGGHTDALIDNDPNASDGAAAKRARFAAFLRHSVNGCDR